MEFSSFSMGCVCAGIRYGVSQSTQLNTRLSIYRHHVELTLLLFPMATELSWHRKDRRRKLSQRPGREVFCVHVTQASGSDPGPMTGQVGTPSYEH